MFLSRIHKKNLDIVHDSTENNDENYDSEKELRRIGTFYEEIKVKILVYQQPFPSNLRLSCKSYLTFETH